jgi:hypothetical protein
MVDKSTSAICKSIDNIAKEVRELKKVMIGIVDMVYGGGYKPDSEWKSEDD